MLARGFNYVYSYITSAKDLEKLLDCNVQTLKRGGGVAGYGITIPGRLAASLVVLTFAVLYACFIGYIIFQQVH